MLTEETELERAKRIARYEERHPEVHAFGIGSICIYCLKKREDQINSPTPCKRIMKPAP